MDKILDVPPKLRRFYRIGFLCHSLFIGSVSVGAYLGVIPTKITVIPYYDTILHFLLVGMFGFFLDGALSHRAIVSVPFIPRLGPSIALFLAASEEYLQRLSPRRSSSWGDFAANATGILVCAFFARQLTLAKISQNTAEPAPESAS